jgi:ParB family chromosome partitioning protein
MLAPQFKQIPLSQIRWRSQVRQHPEADQESLVALSQTIKTRGGVLQSICVYVDGDGYEGICGQRRSLAAAMAGISTVPAMVWPTVPSREELAEIQLIENTHRMPLRPIEHATALRGLISLSGTTATEIARRLGLSDASVSRSLKLLELPEAIRVQVDNG